MKCLCNTSEYYEITGSSSITRKRLQSSVGCSKIHKASTLRRRTHDRYGIRASNTQGSSSETQSLQVHSPEVHPQWHLRGCQSWRRLQSEDRSTRALHPRKYQAEINKASDCWQRTIEDLVALGLMVQPWKSSTKAPWNSLPFFMIHACMKICKSVLHKNVGSDRKDLPMEDNSRTIPIKGRGYEAIVDEKWYGVLSKSRWYLCDGYARGDIDGKSIYMHRIICHPPESYLVDHINRNRLDNRETNLRIVTLAQNARNRGKYSNNTTGYKGVYFLKAQNIYTAGIHQGGKLRHLGRFHTPIDAARAYNKAAIEFYGEHAWINPIDETTSLLTQPLASTCNFHALWENKDTDDYRLTIESAYANISSYRSRNTTRYLAIVQGPNALRLQEDCFTTIADAKEWCERWMQHFNEYQQLKKEAEQQRGETA